MLEGITLLRLRKSSTAYEAITYEGITPLCLHQSSSALEAITYEGITPLCNTRNLLEHKAVQGA